MWSQESDSTELLGWAFVHTDSRHPFVLPLLLFFSSHSMTSVKRTSFPENFPSTRTRTRVSRKQVMLTVSMWIQWSTENKCRGTYCPAVGCYHGDSFKSCNRLLIVLTKGNVLGGNLRFTLDHSFSLIPLFVAILIERLSLKKSKKKNLSKLLMLNT